MTPLTDTEGITGEMLYRMVDLGPCELVRGRIIPMSPANWRHGILTARLTEALARQSKPKRVGRVLTGEVGVYTGRDPDTVRGADVAFISNERLARVQSKSFLDVAPELLVEVISPSNTWQDTQDKVKEYFGVGAEVVWVVEPKPRRVLVYRDATTAETLGEADALRGTGVLAGFELALADLFADL